ncbi:hypothetical protein QNZ80_004684 [Vibrio parahaemolyticus]|nr:hypothetical protein [Vibrio parahaemolyticus]ELB2187058.1 hypothetical protein [Vibrio parahaemolyticus]ELB2194956.1 hypothetical protein [Vibrio parahaemolyticus]ELB2215045.1 hypothetical protein [Vibrio parahaemolyticus]ELB2234783.1 hypothetical protein [Vibrio parahaemolyticus]
MSKRQLVATSIVCVTAIHLNGCAGSAYVPKVSESEVNKYETLYISEYQALQTQYADWKPDFKWVQPNNIEEACKVYVSIDPKDDKTIKPDYELFWDGGCKDGYAYGLGREIENTMLMSLHQIGFYEGGKAVNYCASFDPLNKWYREQECSYDHKVPNHFVMTQFSENGGDLQLSYMFGVSGTRDNPQLVTKTYPFHDIVEYFKYYPNFTYVIQDFRSNEFDNRNFEFFLRKNDTGKSNGFGFATLKNGQRNAGEIIDGNFTRAVELPESYYQKANAILEEVSTASNKALDAQKKALIIKEKYKKRVCKENVTVEFMNNEEYKAICNEEKDFAILQNRVNAKLAQIEQQKSAKRAQINEQRLVAAREAEAQAAQRSASAQEQANFNQSIQNMNQNLQMQQLNNNLMMYNLLPKTHNIYIH